MQPTELWGATANYLFERWKHFKHLPHLNGHTGDLDVVQLGGQLEVTCIRVLTAQERVAAQLQGILDLLQILLEVAAAASSLIRPGGSQVGNKVAEQGVPPTRWQF